MRTSWTNLILHTTALIYRRKESLLVSHAFKAVLDVLFIVVLELFLAFISFPLYLVSKESDLGGKKQYKVRRVISLSLLTTILVVWVLKLIFVVAVPFYFDTRQAFFVSETGGQAAAISSDYLLPNIYSVRVDESVLPPTISDALKIQNGRLFLGGKGDPGTSVIMTIRKEATGEQGGVDFYITSVDEAGSWSMGTDKDSARLAPGKYWLQVMSYHPQSNTISALSPIQSFVIGQDWRWVGDRVDIYLNYTVVTFLILSITSIALLI